MSTQDPGTNAQADQDIAVPVPREPGGSRRFVASFAAAVLCLGTVGAGVWAWRSFMDQGAQPAEALPSSTLAYAALDLDPPGGQKLEAFKTLQKFPSIKKDLGLDNVDDVQKSLVDQAIAGSDCDLSYATFKPWLGDRMAVAVVQQHQPELVVVLQVADADKARTSLAAKSSGCDFGFTVEGNWAILARSNTVAREVGNETKAGGTLSEHPDYKRLTRAAGSAGLLTLYAAPEAGQALLDAIDDDPFSGFFIIQAVNSALDPITGFITSFGFLAFSEPAVGYASSDESSGSAYAPNMTAAQKKEQARLDRQYAHYDELTPAQRKALDKEQEQFLNDLFGPNGEKLPQMSGNGSSSSSSGGLRYAGSGPVTAGPGSSAPVRTAFGEDDFPEPKIDPAIRDSLKHFTGLGGIGRISDGTVEVEIVGDPLVGTSGSMYAGSQGKDLVSALPKNSAVAFGAGLADGWVDLLFKQISTQFVFTGSSQDQTVKSFEKSTGLDVPGDLEALGGDGLSIVAGPGLSPDDIFQHPERADVAARLTGDPDKIEAALDKLRAHGATHLVSRRDGDVVFVSANKSYLDDVTSSDGLGGSDAFDQVLPDADQAASVFFINFDAGDWLVNQTSGSDRADAKPLHALGMSVTKTDGQQHVRIRLSFD